MKNKLTPFLKEDELIRLKSWANHISAFYAGKIYLVGSVMQKKDWRDVDICCVISDHDFYLRYRKNYVDKEVYNSEKLQAGVTPSGIFVKQWEEEKATGEYTVVSWNWNRDVIKRWRNGCIETGLNLDFKVWPETHHKLYEQIRDCILRLDENPFVD